MEVSASGTKNYLDTLDRNFGQELEFEAEEEEEEEDSVSREPQVRSDATFSPFQSSYVTEKDISS